MRRDRVEQPVLPYHNVRTVAFVALTAGALFFCAWLGWPFLPALTWAVALAVLAMPLHRRIERVVSHPNVAAALSTTTVVLLIGVPVTIVTAKLIGDSQSVVETMREESSNGIWRERVARVPQIGPWLSRLDLAEVEARRANRSAPSRPRISNWPKARRARACNYSPPFSFSSSAFGTTATGRPRVAPFCPSQRPTRIDS